MNLSGGTISKLLGLALLLCILWIVFLRAEEREQRSIAQVRGRQVEELRAQLEMPKLYDAHNPKNRNRHREDVTRFAAERERRLLPDGDLATIRASILELNRLRESLQQHITKSFSEIGHSLDQLSQEAHLQPQKPVIFEQQLQPQQRQPVMIQPQPALANPPAGTQLDWPAKPAPKEQIATLLFTHARPDYLKRTMDSILALLPEGSPFFVSQDGSHEPTLHLLQSSPYRDHLTLFRHTDRGTPPSSNFPSYWYISQHYKWALGRLFREYSYNAVIILEDDLELAPDFFEYFQAALPLLRQDSTLFCVSAYNDHASDHNARDPLALRRTNFFPGLGWLITRELWVEIGTKWPSSFWDDWLREPAQRRDRDCIQPEISRTKTFGVKGSSGGQFFNYLESVKLNSVPVRFTELDLQYLLKPNWDPRFEQMLQGATSIRSLKDMSASTKADFRYAYTNHKDYKHFIESLPEKYRVLADEKAGVPRSSYKGVVQLYIESNRLFVVPTSLQV